MEANKLISNGGKVKLKCCKGKIVSACHFRGLIVPLIVLGSFHVFFFIRKNLPKTMKGAQLGTQSNFQT